MIKVLLADDQTLVRDALRALLELQPGIQVVAEAATGTAALELCLNTAADVALLDIEMPQMSGIDVVQRLREAGNNLPALMVTTFGRPGYVERALAAGVNGFVVKDAPAAELVAAIEAVLQGKTVVDPQLAVSALAVRSPLTPRELEVLRAAADGAAVRAVAQRLHLSVGTVRNHLSAINHKLGVESRAAAVYEAQQAGWL